MNPLFEAIDRIMDTSERAQLERAKRSLRADVFAKAGAELYLERVNDDMALIRLNIGHMAFSIGQPRNGTEAASVMRTFRDALDTLLLAAKECGQEAADCARFCACPEEEACRLKQCECVEIDAADRRFPKE